MDNFPPPPYFYPTPTFQFGVRCFDINPRKEKILDRKSALDIVSFSTSVVAALLSFALGGVSRSSLLLLLCAGSDRIGSMK
jgi:hypothetical protein